MAPPSTLTSIVIVNWNTRRLLERCLAALRATTSLPHELVLVDNGSTDGSAELVRSLAGPSTRAVLLPENRGFAAGTNRGIEHAAGGALCLLNSDVQATPGWLEGLHRALERRGAGLVGPYTDRARGPQRRRLLLGRLPPPWRRTREVDSLAFFCVLLRREVIDAVGLLDERFGLGTYEDDDYCRRARAAGFRLFIASGSWVWHEAHGTFRANALDEGRLRAANRAVFEEKWRERAEP